MMLLTLMLAGLQPPTLSKSHPKPVHKKHAPMAVVSPPPIIDNPPPQILHPPVPTLRRAPARMPFVAPAPVPREPTAPLDLAIVKQPNLDKFYPKELRKAGLEDSAAISLTIDRKGKVAACRIRSAPANPAFVEPACALGSKLRFAEAAMDYPGPLPIKVEWRAGGVALVRAVLPTGPKVVPGSVTMSESDYPVGMRRVNAQGRVVARIVVPPDGKATDCKIEWTDVLEDFDDATCRVVLRARFVPARDEFGVAVPGRVFQAVRWKLEDSDPIPAISYSLTVKLMVSANGKILSCTPSTTGPVPAAVVAEQCSKQANDEILSFPKLAGIRGHAALITLQTAFTMDGDPAFAPLRARVPRAAWGRSVSHRVHFDIRADGTMGHCAVVEAVGDVNNLCYQEMGPYAAVTGADAARPRAASFYMGLIAEPAP